MSRRGGRHHPKVDRQVESCAAVVVRVRGVANSACVGAVGLDIGQLADVAGGRSGQDERVEVRIALDALDPPAGRIRVSGDDSELRFTGWLGLLRVLYQVMGAPAGPQAAAPDTEES